MEERIDIPKNTEELAHYLEEVLHRLESEGVTGGFSQREGISLTEKVTLDSENMLENQGASH